MLADVFKVAGVMLFSDESNGLVPASSEYSLAVIESRVIEATASSFSSLCSSCKGGGVFPVVGRLGATSVCFSPSVLRAVKDSESTMSGLPMAESSIDSGEISMEELEVAVGKIVGEEDLGADSRAEFSPLG